MLSAKPMPHRRLICTGVSHQGGVVTISTLRHSAEPDVTGTITLSAVRDDLIKVTFVEGACAAPRPSLSVVDDRAGSVFTVVERPQELLLSTASLQLTVAKDGCAITYADRHGQVFLREAPAGGKYLTPIDIEVMRYPTDAEIEVIESVDGVKMRSAAGERVVDRSGFRAELRLLLAADEAIYGLGQHEEGILNYRHRLQYLYQQNMKVAMPVMVSSRGYGLFWDSHALTTFDDTGEACSISIDAADSLSYYVLYGPEFDQVVDGIRHLSGAVPMLPRWAYGYMQSKERYESAEELLAVVAEYRRREVPLDCIILDWQSWTGELWGQKSFDPERFPDPAALCEDLHREHARLMISIWPNMRGGGENHAELNAAGYLLGNQATYDAYSAEARALYWQQAERGLFQYGVDAWWCDCTEPFEADWNGPHKLDPTTRMHINTAEAKKYLDPTLINGYSLAHSAGLYHGQRESGSAKRVVNLTRSGGVGQQRYNTITWSGDIEARWSRMRKQIADGLNFTITGSPRWTLDIGAFFVKPGAPWFWDGVYPTGNLDLGYRELYLRWLQMAVFLPIFRSHGTDTAREIWCFGDHGEAVYDAIKASIELRYRLLPYLYSLAAWECQRSYTTFRNLAFDFRTDPSVHAIDDQFLCGPSLMVCPVCAPQEYGPNSTPLTDVSKQRRIYLPRCVDAQGIERGRYWYDFHTHQRFDGGQWITVETTMDRIPVFVPAGSIIPMGPVAQHAQDRLDAAWTLQVFAGADGSFDIYEDEGDGHGYESGAYSWRCIRWNDTAQSLAVAEAEGDFTGQMERNFKQQLIGTSVA